MKASSLLRGTVFFWLTLAPLSAWAAAGGPKVIVDHYLAFDQFWCRGSMIPEVNPAFPGLIRANFKIGANDIVEIPQSWSIEAARVVPELKRVARERTEKLLAQAATQVGRPFRRQEFPVFLYLCPTYEGAIGLPAVFPLFPYLQVAAGAGQWPVSIFSDHYLFHELLHLYVMETVDYTKGTPLLNRLYTQLMADEDFLAKVREHAGSGTQLPTGIVDYISLVLTHVHLDAIQKVTFLSLGEEATWREIVDHETNNVSPHPSYVKAWEFVNGLDSAGLRQLLDELKD